MRSSWASTIMGELAPGRSLAPDDKQERALRTRLFDSSISEWKRLDRLSAAREFKMEVLAKLFIAKRATSARTRTLASGGLVHLENQVASRFQQFWVE
jgi:hypothetical protein